MKNGNSNLCYVDYDKVYPKNKSPSGSAHFLYPIFESKNDIFTLEYMGNGSNIEESIENEMQGNSGKILYKNGIFSYEGIPISVPINFNKENWISPDNSYKCHGNKIHYSMKITCKSDKNEFFGNYSPYLGLEMYEKPCGSSICTYVLRGKYGLFSSRFFDYYTEIGVEFKK
jgi:hypothetical protein